MKMFALFQKFKTASLIPVFMMLSIISCGNTQFAIDQNSIDGSKEELNVNINNYIRFDKAPGLFPLFEKGEIVDFLIDKNDYKGIHYVSEGLREDFLKVCGNRPEVKNMPGKSKHMIIIGSLDKSQIIQEIVENVGLDISALKGKREKFYLTVIENPLKGIEKAIVIIGSDKRGCIYGMYDLSKRIGVSPWHFWADVPVKKREYIGVQSVGIFTDGEPDVKYRGIFINDEAPALTGWVYETYGEFNHEFYGEVFELILRLRGNFLWPAMWPPRSFFDDDIRNHELADELGVIISTSHHEPLMRSHADWYKYGSGEWNYEKNKEVLQDFWRVGIENMGEKESLVTVGMRGDGDKAMSETTAIELLKEIIVDQRKIISEVSGKAAEETPQVWAIYKEVQDYYDKGLRVDEDILVLFCDDNWGNIRILPKREDKDRKGGYGIYYHVDYVGGPVSYKWLNVSQIERIWEQMELAYTWGAQDLWVLNVGDIKPMELPISFFLDFAWNNEAIQAHDLPEYYKFWATQQFGPEFSEEIAEILSLYTKYNARRHPETLKTDTYSISNYREADNMQKDYHDLVVKARRISKKLPAEMTSAFYQLVLYPVEACSNQTEMLIAAGKNQLYAIQGRTSANNYADRVKELFAYDEELTRVYHEDISDGKWNHMMSQTHLGYTYWNNPPVNKMPAVSWVHSRLNPEMGYVIENGGEPDFEGSTLGHYSKKLPTFDPINDQNYYIELYNNGKDSISYSLVPEAAWIKLSSKNGSFLHDQKVLVSIDWEILPKGVSKSHILLSGTGRTHRIGVEVKTALPECKGFVENNGVISMEASSYDKAINAYGIEWVKVPNLGRTATSVIVQPSDARVQTPGVGSPCLEYSFSLFNSSDIVLHTYVSPTLNYKKNEGLKFAVSIDNEEPQIINIHEGDVGTDWDYPEWWENSVVDNIRIKKSKHLGLKNGNHTLKVWMVDPGVVFQKFVIDAGGLKPSYLGPPESNYINFSDQILNKK